MDVSLALYTFGLVVWVVDPGGYSPTEGPCEIVTRFEIEERPVFVVRTPTSGHRVCEWIELWTQDEYDGLKRYRERTAN